MTITPRVRRISAAVIVMTILACSIAIPLLYGRTVALIAVVVAMVALFGVAVWIFPSHARQSRKEQSERNAGGADPSPAVVFFLRWGIPGCWVLAVVGVIIYMLIVQQ